MVLKGLVDRAALLPPGCPRNAKSHTYWVVEQQATGSAYMTHRHYGLPAANPRPTYTEETRPAAWSGGAIVGAIMAIVIVLSFAPYELTKV